MESLRIYAELRGYGNRGPRYRVHADKPDGMVLVESSTEPLFEAARTLLSQGIKGKLQLWDNIRPYWRMQGDIERLAHKTVSEGDDGICLRKYVERTTSGDFEDEPCQRAQNEIGRPKSVLQASIRGVGIPTPSKEAA